MNYFCSWISDFLEMNYFLGAGDLLLDISILGDGLLGYLLGDLLK
jgi:hypothetical protein